MGPFKLIRDHLAGESPGAIPWEHARDIEALLGDCWDRLAGSRQGGMRDHKLVGRTEDMNWQPPILTFSIERHGAPGPNWCSSVRPHADPLPPSRQVGAAQPIGADRGFARYEAVAQIGKDPGWLTLLRRAIAPGT